MHAQVQHLGNQVLLRLSVTQLSDRWHLEEHRCDFHGELLVIHLKSMLHGDLFQRHLLLLQVQSIALMDLR
jgi:hypothetical protein